MISDMLKKIFDLFFYNENYCFFCKEEKIYKNFLCKNCIDRLIKYDVEIYNDYDEKNLKKEIIYYYKSDIKNKIREFKFKDGIYLKNPFASLIYDFLDKKLLEKIDYIAYVPSSKKKLILRGYNHCKLLAIEISKYSNKPIFENLKKIKNTKSQHFLSLEERRINLKNAFEVDVDLTKKKILLIDDIHTSGSTVYECYKELKRKNCEFVWIVCLCGVM